MDNRRLEEIENITRDVTEVATGNIGPVGSPNNLVAILKHFRIKLEFARFEDPDIGGAYDKTKKAIYVSTADRPTRQAFTVAHEIGHFVLHKKKLRDIFFRSQTYAFDDDQEKQEEKEANWFAACLLMPKELVKNAWYRDHDVDLVAAYFGVSKTAAFWRLKNLRLIK